MDKLTKKQQEKVCGGLCPHINHSNGKGGKQGIEIADNGIDDDGDGKVDE